MSKIAILGCGFGTAIAVMTDRCGHEVVLWSAFENEVEDIRKHGENRRLLPGIPVEASIGLTSDISRIGSSEVVIFAVPSKFIREVAKKASGYINKDAVVVCVAKGLESGTYKRLSEVLGEEIKNNIVVLSGPCHAEEIARGVPTTVVASSKNYESAKFIQDSLTNKFFRIYLNDDITGVEIGGALKNIIALCAGICDGYDLGDNAKAALMTRGITEIARLGVAMGAKSETFAGLSGIGDLIVTCMSMHSRNRRAGILIGQGVSPEEAVSRTGTVEGYTAVKNAYGLAEKYNIDMPITSELYELIYEGKNFKQAILDLMNRPQRHESEVIWLNKNY